MLINEPLRPRWAYDFGRNPSMKRTLLLCVLLMVTLIAISGCNTVRGMGQDIEKGGEAIQRTADS